MNIRDCTSWEQLRDAAPGSVGGWMTMEEREMLFQFAKAMPSKGRMVEIGVFGGTTLSIFALMNDGLDIVGIDSFENDTICDDPCGSAEKISVRDLCHRTLKINGVTKKVRIIERSSHAVGPGWSDPIDLLIIDGDHSFAGAYQDMDDFARWVVPGGRMIVDDYFSILEVRNAVDYWMTQSDYRSEWVLEFPSVPFAQHDAAKAKMIVFRKQAAE